MRFSGELDWIYNRVLEKAKANLKKKSLLSLFSADHITSYELGC